MVDVTKSTLSRNDVALWMIAEIGVTRRCQALLCSQWRKQCPSHSYCSREVVVMIVEEVKRDEPGAEYRAFSIEAEQNSAPSTVDLAEG
jgi:hypothetical protein